MPTSSASYLMARLVCSRPTCRGTPGGILVLVLLTGQPGVRPSSLPESAVLSSG